MCVLFDLLRGHVGPLRGLCLRRGPCLPSAFVGRQRDSDLPLNEFVDDVG